LSKIVSELERRKPEKGSVLYVLTGSGSYSPPHRMHISMFEQTRAFIEANEKGNMVIGGFIAPSCERYVNRKLKDDAIPLADRIKLTALVCAESSWINVCEWGIASSCSIAHRTAMRLEESHIFEPYGCTFQVLELYGADTILHHIGRVTEDHERPPLRDGYVRRFAVLGRPGSTETVLELCGRFPLFAKSFKVIPGELEDVSSTQVRRALREHDYDTLHQLIQCEPVERYLTENISALYAERERIRSEQAAAAAKAKAAKASKGGKGKKGKNSKS